jgi:type I restriction enzyme S subunit
MSKENRLTDRIPASWEVAELGELGRWYGGGTPSTERSDYWEGGTILWCRQRT